MKKILIIALILLMSGCSNSTASGSTVTQADIEGDWVMIEDDWMGEITDMAADPYTYLQITDENIYYYYECYEQPGYYDMSATKYYKLEDDQLYYDYYELTGSDWKENIDDLYGGVFTVSRDGDILTLTEYYSDDPGDYDKETYQKIAPEDQLKAFQ